MALNLFVSGGLISYGPDILEMFRRAAGYADKVLKGANPAELPIEQPTKFVLVVDLKTATACGITIPLVGAASSRRSDPVDRFILLLAFGAHSLSSVVQCPLTGNFPSTPG